MIPDSHATARGADAIRRRRKANSCGLNVSSLVDILTAMATATAPTVDLARAVELFHALSDETRLEIVQRLRGGERCVCDLTDLLDAAQSRLSFHLKVLKDAGLVHDRRDGRWVHYHLNPDAFSELQDLLGEMKPSARRLTVVATGCC